MTEAQVASTARKLASEIAPEAGFKIHTQASTTDGRVMLKLSHPSMDKYAWDTWDYSAINDFVANAHADLNS